MVSIYFQSDKLADVQEKSSSGLGDRIDAISNDTVYYYSSGDDIASITSIKIGTVTCDPGTQTVSSGVNSITIQDCDGTMRRK